MYYSHYNKTFQFMEYFYYKFSILFKCKVQIQKIGRKFYFVEGDYC